MNDRLAAESTGVIRRGEARTPGQAAITRNAHQNVAGAEGLIPLGVAVAVEGTGCGVVADCPILVVEMSLIDDDRVAPIETIGGAADGDVSDQRAATQPGERQGGDQPLSMLCIVSDGGICCGAVGSAFEVDGEAGEIAVVPGLAAVDGGREATSPLPHPTLPGRRATWKALTMVLPQAKVSGSTSVL